MKGWLETPYLEDELSHFAPALDELLKHSKQYVADIQDVTQLENFISFYSAYDDSKD